MELMEDLQHLSPPDGTGPKVVFQSDLKLSREREARLCERAQDWFRTLDDQMGRTISASPSGGEMNFASMWGGGTGEERQLTGRKFMVKRTMLQLTAENDVTWRKWLQPGSIFEKSNMTVPLSRRIAKQSAARAVNYFFGTDPWLAMFPIGANDQQLARALQKLTDIKFQESGSLDVIRRATAKAFDIGESIIKTTQTIRKTRFKELAVVMVGPDGNPVLATDGLPIREEDLLTQNDAGVTILKRAPDTVLPQSPVFAQVEMEQDLVTYEGPEFTHIYFRDFLCPLNATDVQSAECCIHMMERTATQLAQMCLASMGEFDLQSLQNAVQAIGAALSGDHFAQTGDRGARPELGETETYVTQEPVTEYGEFYLRFDADGDGVAEDIMLIMNPVTGLPIYYNYVANVSSTGLRPFDVIRGKAVLNRWYGQGSLEEFQTHQDEVDLVYNRRNFNQSVAGRVTFWNPTGVVEGDSNPNLKLNGGQTYTLKQQAIPENVLRVVYLDDNKHEHLTEELEFIMQLALNESGVQHANDAQTAGLASAKLATGVRNIEKSGQELFALYIGELEAGITAAARAFVTTLYSNIGDQEVVHYLEGDVPQQFIIEGRDVRDLKFDVQVLLTRFRSEQVLQSNSQAVQICNAFYALMPQLQIIQAPLYREMLRSLQVQNADDYIIPQPMPLAGPTGPVSPQAVPNEAPLQPPPNL